MNRLASTGFHLGLALVPVLSMGCKKAEKVPPTTGSDTTGSGSASLSTGSGSAGSGSATVAPTCDLAGNYRFRFRSNGADGWWFRFKVEGAKATLVEPAPVLAIPAGPIDVTLDPAACKLTLKTTGDAVGELVVTLALDPKTHAITGQFVRTKAHDQDTTIAVTGAHDLGEPKSAVACVVPGLYTLEWDPKVVYKNSESDDKRSCKDASPLPTTLKVEPFGDTVAISRRESSPPYAEEGGSDSVTRVDDCTVAYKLGTEMLTLEAKLTFAGDKVTGVAGLTNFQVIEDGEQGEGLWNCVAKDAPITLKRVP